MALLMAMGDAERCLTGRIAFRTDSQTVANLKRGSSRQYEHLCGRVKLLLARHPEWTLVLVEGMHKKIADDLSRRPFKAERHELTARETRAYPCRKNDWRRRG